MVSGSGACAFAKDVAFVTDECLALAGVAGAKAAASSLLMANRWKSAAEGFVDLADSGGGGGGGGSGSGSGSGSSSDFGNIELTAEQFEKSISHLSPSERVAAIKTRAREIATKKQWTKRGDLAARNGGHEIYWEAAEQKYYSVDTTHGRFEMFDKRGKHLGEVDFDFKPTDFPDAAGLHDIEV
ncbi:MAG: hypothetical protein LBU57_01205 [Dysgonamonadaceae bacterium]|jgi:hypothetical protein|nr:hypothetical protein [Dysgonamonadaceae bacterium]